MKTVNIKEKLVNMGVTLDSVVMGDFDMVGEFTAKRFRGPQDENYKRYGAAFRANYERGILIYYLIRQYNLNSFLEIGFGRGYATFCAAKAFYDMGMNGKIMTIDPNLNEDYLNKLSTVIPHELFKYVQFKKGTSVDILPTVDEKFGLVFIDGDHSYEATRVDWELTREKYTHFCLFDDYLRVPARDPGLKCYQAINEIDWEKENCNEPELIILDRRMFVDDRGYSDEQIDYGEVLFTKKDVSRDEW